MHKIQVKINDEEVELTDFPAKIIVNAIIGMLGSLRGVDEIRTAVIELEQTEG